MGAGPGSVYTAPPQATFLQKLGPGGAATLALALSSALVLLGVPWLWALARVLRQARRDEAAPGDAILVLGRQLDEGNPTAVFQARLAHAALLWRQGLAPRILVAGGTTGRAVRTEAEAGRAWLVAHGTPAEAIHLEAASQHTVENLFHVRALLRSEGWGTLLLVSDPLHMARAQATARGLGLPVRCCPAASAPPIPGSLGWWLRAGGEAFLLHWYWVGLGYCRLFKIHGALARIT
ncbi:MAG: YdcF family protein [Holophagaceae bacterium]